MLNPFFSDTVQDNQCQQATVTT